MRAAAIALALALSACGNNVGAIEQDCAASHARFLDQWACTKAETIRRGGLADRRQGHLTRYYIAQGDVIAERVRAGQMTDTAARAEMARLFIEVKRQADAERPVFRPYEPPPEPPTITCTTFGNTTTCR